MTPKADYTGLLGTIATSLPAIITAIRADYVTRRAEGAPPPTDADVIAALRQYCDDTLAKDAAILAAHPADPSTPGA